MVSFFKNLLLYEKALKYKLFPRTAYIIQNIVYTCTLNTYQRELAGLHSESKKVKKDAILNLSFIFFLNALVL